MPRDNKVICSTGIVKNSFSRFEKKRSAEALGSRSFRQRRLLPRAAAKLIFFARHEAKLDGPRECLSRRALYRPGKVLLACNRKVRRRRHRRNITRTSEDSTCRLSIKFSGVRLTLLRARSTDPLPPSSSRNLSHNNCRACLTTRPINSARLIARRMARAGVRVHGAFRGWREGWTRKFFDVFYIISIDRHFIFCGVI